MGILIDALSVISGRNRQEVLNVFQSCATTDPDRPGDRPSIELLDVERALGLESGFFKRIIEG